MIIIEYNLIAYISSMACPANGDFFFLVSTNCCIFSECILETGCISMDVY